MSETIITKNNSETLIIRDNYNIKDSKINGRTLTEEEAKKYNEERFSDPVWDVCRFTQRVVHPWSDRDFKRQWGMIPDLSLAAPLAIGAAMKIAPMVQYVLMNAHQM